MSKKILICDDEESIRESFKLILAEEYDLVATDSAEQCLDFIFHAKDIGLVLLDIKMPKMSGLEILKKIKEKHPQVKVIVITGYKSVETATQAVKLGADGYLVKPFKADEIQETVKKHLP